MRTISVRINREVEVEGSAIYHKTGVSERGITTRFGCTRKIDGLRHVRDAFVGCTMGCTIPRPCGWECTNSHAYGWESVGAHQIDLISAGPGKPLRFVLGTSKGGPGRSRPPFVLKKPRPRNPARSDLERIGPAFRRGQGALEELLATYQAPQSRTLICAAWSNMGTRCQPHATFISRLRSVETGMAAHGLPRLQPGHSRFLHLLPSGAASDPRHRLDPALDGHFSPLPSVTKRQRHIGAGLTTNPSGSSFQPEPTSAKPATSPSSTLHAAMPTSPARSTRSASLDTSIATRSTTRPRHACRSSATPIGTTGLNLNCSPRPEHPSSAPATSRLESRVGHDRRPLPLRGADLAALYRFMGKSPKSPGHGYYADMLRDRGGAAWDGCWYTRAFDAQAGRRIEDLRRGKISSRSQAWCVLGGAE